MFVWCILSSIFNFLVLIFHGFVLQFSSKLLSGTDWEGVLINHILLLEYTKGSLWGSGSKDVIFSVLGYIVLHFVLFYGCVVIAKRGVVGRGGNHFYDKNQAVAWKAMCRMPRGQ